MGQEDRLKKQIDQLAKALANLLARLTGLNSANTTFEAIEQVNAKLKDELKLDLDELADLPDDSFITNLTTTHGLTNAHVNLLADVIYTTVKLHPHPSQAKKLSAKALLLYKHLAAIEKNYSLDWDIKIAELSKIV
ncbi:hypothetical protein ACFGVR_00760 [Mucilaginibacter sp. AW1-3]